MCNALCTSLSNFLYLPPLGTANEGGESEASDVAARAYPGADDVFLIELASLDFAEFHVRHMVVCEQFMPIK